MKKITVAGCALNQTPLDFEGNFVHIAQAIAQSQEAGVELLLLPELAVSGYGCEDALLMDYVPQQSVKTLHKIMPLTEGIAVVVGLPMLIQNALYDCAALIQDTRLLGIVPKQKLAGDGVHYEPRWFRAWPAGIQTTITVGSTQCPVGDLVFELDGVRVGIEICEDAWHSARPAEHHFLRNVDIICNPSASPFAIGKAKRRYRLITESSRACHCTYLYANLLGNESGRLIFDGEVLIASNGQLLAENKRLTFDTVCVVSATVDLSVNRQERRHYNSYQPHVIDNAVKTIGCRGPENLNPVTPVITPNHLTAFEEFEAAVTLGLWDYMYKTKSRGFVVSLSGGADSSACAVLAARAIQKAFSDAGCESRRAYLSIEEGVNPVSSLLTCVYQSSNNSSETTKNAAQVLAHDLGARFDIWDIAPLVAQYTERITGTLNRPLDWSSDDIALQNVQARVRVPGIWLMANICGALLLATGNRSETAVGYMTMDGDTSGGLAPIAGIDKPFLRQWLVWAEQHLGITGLKPVNQLAPTAELRPSQFAQTDESDLMPYPILTAIEQAFIQQGLSPLGVYSVLKETLSEVDLASLRLWIIRFFRLWASNQWKRERLAPSFHLADWNLDPRSAFRFPILSRAFLEELATLEAM